MDSQPKPAWLLQIEQLSYGWTISYFGPDGHVRHVLNAESEIQAFRAGYKLARLYGLKGKFLVKTNRGEFVYDIERLMNDFQFGKHR